MEDSPPRKYYLSRKACLGILRRARERGKPLPPQLEAALNAQAGLTVYVTPIPGAGQVTAFAANQRDEVRDLHDVAGALSAQPNGASAEAQRSGFGGERSRSEMSETSPQGGGKGYGACGDEKQQTFVAGIVSKGNGDCFLTPERHTSLSGGGGQAGQGYPCILTADCLNPWDTQQTRIFTPEGTAPTLAGADGCGGRNPGGLVLDGDTAGYGACLTPWDTQQARITAPEGVSPTINSGEAKPGGLIFAAGFCAGAGPSAGSIGYQEEVAPTLKAAASGNMMPSVLFGAPARAQQSGSRGERRSSEMSELPPQGGSEGYGACDDAMMPSVLCLNDQGGQIMELSEDVSGTLRAQEHGHQPLVFENHGIDARYTGPHKVAPTLSARAGTGGNNLSLVMQEEEPVFCITGNAIDRQPENGGNGLGIQEDVAYTLTATDHHAVFARQRCDKFQKDGVASTQSAHQQKDVTDLIYQAGAPARAQGRGSRGERRSSGMSELSPVGGSEGYAACDDDGALTADDSKGPNSQYVSQDKLVVEAPLLIRRLTPRECERLQGFPDDWTALPGAADAPRYRALGNSVAIPCVEYLMHGMALVLRGELRNAG